MPVDQNGDRFGAGPSVRSRWLPDPEASPHLVLDGPITQSSGDAVMTVEGRPVLALPALRGSGSGLVRAVDLATGVMLPDRALLRYDRHEVLALGAGRLLATLGPRRETVVVRDAVTGSPAGPPILVGSQPRALALAVAGGRPVVAAMAPGLSVWEVSTGALITRSDGFSGRHFAMYQGRLLLLAEKTIEALTLYDVLTGERFGQPIPCDNCLGVFRLSAVDDNGRLLVAFLDGVTDTTALGTVDGQPTVALGDAYGELRLFDARTAAEFSSPYYGGPVYSDIVGTVDNSLILRGRPMRRWDLAAGGPAARLDRSFPGITSSATGRLDGRPVIAVVCGDRDAPAVLAIWDPRADVLVAEVTLEPFTTGKLRPGRVVFTEIDGHAAAAVVIGSTVHVWDAATGEPRGRPYPGLDASVVAIAAGRAGDRPVIAVSGKDRLIHLFDPATGEAVVPPMAGHSRTVTALALGMSDDRAVLISAGWDNTLRVWDATTGEAVGGPWNTGYDDAIQRVQVIEWNGEPVALSSSRGGPPRLWRLRARNTYAGHTDAVRTVAAGRWAGRPVFASGGDDRTVRLWDAATGEPLGQAFTDHAAPVTHVTFSGPARDILITGDQNGVVMRRQHRDGAPHSEPLARLEKRIAGIGTADVDGRTVVGIGTDDGLRVWDTVTGRHHAELRTGPDVVVIHTHPGVLDGKLIALTIAYYDGDDDPMLALWDVTTGRPLSEPMVVSQDSGTLGTLASLNGQLVAIQGEPQDDNYPEADADVQVVDVATRTVLTRSRRRRGGSQYATVAPSTTHDVVLIAADDTVVVIDPHETTGEFEYRGHRATVTCLAATEVDGRTVVASSDLGNALHLWYLNSGERIR